MFNAAGLDWFRPRDDASGAGSLFGLLADGCAQGPISASWNEVLTPTLVIHQPRR
jgi:hypothetical protein